MHYSCARDSAIDLPKANPPGSVPVCLSVCVSVCVCFVAGRRLKGASLVMFAENG